ncbi:hypothetical protein EJD97_017894 [Solanum chilense]|uniref:Ubiquitin-like protease family profile domain-containing protein n=1 Tax=Solanum chilense TaxID=4083 RepID=A0A6N2C9B0_SOLCI|nr:hypothetical protein EJD97_017894 [Solanum chilense]
MDQEEFIDTNKPGSFNADELVVEEDFVFPKPLQIVDDDQQNTNTERRIVLHPLLTVDEHTPLPIQSFITVDCNLNKLITNVWDAYYNFDSTVYKDSTEESIIEYINGYKIHVAAPWHTVDNILIPVNIEQIFHWVLIVVSFND